MTATNNTASLTLANPFQEWFATGDTERVEVISSARITGHRYQLTVTAGAMHLEWKNAVAKTIMDLDLNPAAIRVNHQPKPASFLPEFFKKIREIAQDLQTNRSNLTIYPRKGAS